MSGYIGITPDLIFNSIPNRFFYGLRRTDDGELFVAKVDQVKGESININNPGDPAENFNSFVAGQDFFEGRDVNHKPVYDNLVYEQFRWDTANIFYYINDEGELVARVNQAYTYPAGVSSDG